MSYSKEELNKIRWRCSRRGMMEMDEILTAFFDKTFLQLSRSEQETFFILLDQSDTVLWDWFLTSKKPANPAMRQLVDRINAQSLQEKS